MCRISAIGILVLSLLGVAHAGSLTLHTPQALVWDASEGADGYRVYVDGKLYKDVGNVTEINCPTGISVYVTAYNKYAESGPSNVVDLRGVTVKPGGTVTLRRPKPTAIKPVATIEVIR